MNKPGNYVKKLLTKYSQPIIQWPNSFGQNCVRLVCVANKACLVAKAFTQQEQLDDFETFSLIANLSL